MPKVEDININFAVYEDAIEYIGVARVTLPDLTAITNTLSGAGISGNVESVALGHFDAMTTVMNFRQISPTAARLAELRRHNIDLRVAQQAIDSTSGLIVVRNVKHILALTPKKLTGGGIAPAAPADISGEFATSYFATYIDGVKVTEIDPLNFISLINGVDALALVRAALGK